MAQLFANNGYSTLSSAINTSDVTLFIAAGHGSRFPVVAAPDFCFVSLENASGNIEVVKVTAHSAGSTALTIVRAQQGTTARSWAIGDLVELRATAAEMAAWESDIDSLQATRALKAGDSYTGAHDFSGAICIAQEIAPLIFGFPEFHPQIGIPAIQQLLFEGRWSLGSR